MLLFHLRSIAAALAVGAALTSGFTIPTHQTPTRRFSSPRTAARSERTTPSFLCAASREDDDDRSPDRLKAEAAALKARAERLRSEIEQTELRKSAKTTPSSPVGAGSVAATTAATTTTTTAAAAAPPSSPWDIVPSGEPGSGEEREGDREEYRLYVDIGREEGTWMDPRWGASGDRIRFTLDVALVTNRGADPAVASRMVKDNSMGKSSPVYAADTGRYARLRDGFDRMECTGAAYRIDAPPRNQRGRGRGGASATNTVRMVVEVEGTTKADQAYVYGDVSVPPGCLYFSLPAFGNGVRNLSTKEGVVSVRQVGWHTGWRREESRILGVFTARPLREAKARDGY